MNRRLTPLDIKKHFILSHNIPIKGIRDGNVYLAKSYESSRRRIWSLGEEEVNKLIDNKTNEPLCEILEFDVDDENSRVVTYALNGYTATPAFVGRKLK